MALKLTGSLIAIPKLNSVLSPKLQLSTITESLSVLVKPAISSIFSNLNKPSPIDLSGLSSSLPKIINLISGISSRNSSSPVNTETLNTLMQTLQPLLQASSSATSANQTQLLQALPTVIHSLTTLMNNFNNQSNVSESVTAAITTLKPLLAQLANSSTNTNVTQIVSTLNKVLEIAQPIIQTAGTLTSGKADFADVAKATAQSLLPLLASINTDTSKIDMAMLQKTLPFVIASVTTLVSTITKASGDNIPETISGVLKGINPLLKLLAENAHLDTSQTETVNAIYKLLTSVKTVLDFVNNPSLLTLSTDLNDMLDSLKPVVDLLDQKGDLSSWLENVHIPELGNLLSSIQPNAQHALESDLASGSSSTDLPNLSDLLSDSHPIGGIDISHIVPQLTCTIPEALDIIPVPPSFVSLLSQITQSFDLVQPTPYI